MKTNKDLATSHGERLHSWHAAKERMTGTIQRQTNSYTAYQIAKHQSNGFIFKCSHCVYYPIGAGGKKCIKICIMYSARVILPLFLSGTI